MSEADLKDKMAQQKINLHSLNQDLEGTLQKLEKLQGESGDSKQLEQDLKQSRDELEGTKRAMERNSQGDTNRQNKDI